ncbi:GNAT family N-acetyltransferase [Erwinia psidii]|uniref:N-acetyltransferase n=1 Tax=Erwinia psidii TaxID=69224 RepID=A0A3N6S3T0_9GAMM|nr:GNAT family N-acetyltransferase [Erwinia psidii]MCX8957658.1 N-acetyltransferase [Erwinia psidii]MCX8960712.1 N-acetyltransferase [Erwinia psidii]RQM39527.1 N-acetyltransferase [Erwinia psidii]
MPETARLILRQWQAKDLAPFAAQNADTEVMQFFPAPLKREESDRLARGLADGINRRGWGFWAVELKETRQFVGCVALHPQPDKYAFSPCTETGWRLGKAFWHRGLAEETAQACLEYAFNALALHEVVAFTASVSPSERLMKRLGMTRAGEFAHPDLPPDHRLSHHLLYGIQLS